MSELIANQHEGPSSQEIESTSFGGLQMSPPAFQLTAGPPAKDGVVQRQEGDPPLATAPAGEEAEFLPLIDPWTQDYLTEGDPEWNARIQELLDPSGTNGWHVALPSQADMGLEQVDGVRGREGRPPRERVEPSMANYPAEPATAPLESPTASIGRAALIQQMRRRLEGVEIPTESGRLSIYRGGYVYTASRSRESEQSDQYMDYLRDLSVNDLGYERVSADQRRFWPIYRWIMQEGDPSAINAWDSEHVTLGAGFSADTDTLAGGNILNRLPAAYRRQLYAIGVHVEEDGELTILDLDQGSVLHGQDALVRLQTDEARLGFLINAAQSQTEMASDDGAHSMEQRTWMVRAQFEQFMARNAGIPAAVFGWPQANMRFAFKLRHWMGSLSWTGMAATGGNVNLLGNYAFDQLNGRIRLTDDELRAKIRTIAGRGGIGFAPGAIRFRGEPAAGAAPEAGDGED